MSRKTHTQASYKANYIVHRLGAGYWSVEQAGKTISILKIDQRCWSAADRTHPSLRDAIMYVLFSQIAR